ncbi:exonuclease SbcCD subunit D [Rothia sp. ZJ1223]|uniref:exonuclease SbcCD subunit D n=1 Tax=Rothia sp. ZJ1223 TaxID=2811098 RepID=UPI00195EAC91|nr:exonuclease SbcCD subunit D [Rothia sp. ZJ1223]MBM7050969.1 exonuclease SbcCD subunit D [Rothia sp. ZJ1223]
MRILHTSDWHLGRTFHGLSLHETCVEFTNELVELVTTRAIDAVLISGDVYDQAQPRPDTVALLSHTLTRLVKAGAQVIVTSGNHDSALRLGFAADILRAGGLFMLTEASALDIPVELTAGGVNVNVYGIPYLEPRAFAGNWNIEPTHEAVLRHALERIKQDARTRTPHATLVMAHCFVTNGVDSDSERRISVGGALSVPLTLFDSFDYAALGHLHGKQKLSEKVRYSGSPIAYSFSEEKHRKGAWILEVDQSGITSIEGHEWEAGIKLASLTGTLDELTTAENAEHYANTICRITLTDTERPSQALEKLGAVFPSIAELYFKPSGISPATDKAHRLTEKERPLIDVCADFYSYVLGRDLTPAERVVVTSVVEETHTAKVSQ